MRMFWEMFTFETSAASQERFHLCLLSRLVCVQLPMRGLGELRADRLREWQGAAERAVCSLIQRHRDLFVWRHYYCGDFRDVDIAGLSAGHIPDVVHQAYFEGRVLGRTMGRIAGCDGAGVFRFPVRGVSRDVCSLGRSFSHWPESFVVVRAAVSVNHGGADFRDG